MTENLKMIDVRHLFKKITKQLIDLLKSLDRNQLLLPTCYPTWKVKDIASHLLQTGINRLSGQRDKYPSTEKPGSLQFDELVPLIKKNNDSWTSTLSRISPELIISLLEITENQLSYFFETQDMDTEAYYAVTWAGEKNSLNWFDIAREFTERWHHQQQIREAVGAKDLTQPEYLSPVIDTLIRATPFWYQSLKAENNVETGIIITGDASGNWILKHNELHWTLFKGTDENFKTAQIEMSDDTAWRFLTRSIRIEKAEKLIRFTGDPKFSRQFLKVKAILMED